MTIRSWKAVFTAIFFLLVLSYAVQNVANITGGMYASFAYVLGQSDHLAYPDSVVPPIAQPWLIWATLLVKMWKFRAATSSEFTLAKKHALNGLGLAVIIWLLMFGTFGAAVFQMWQTEIGASSFNGAFQLTVYALLLFGLISIEDPDARNTR
jgi:hypothetical protein